MKRTDKLTNWIAILLFAAFAVFPDFFTKLTEAMRQAAHPVPVGEVIPVA